MSPTKAATAMMVHNNSRRHSTAEIDIKPDVAARSIEIAEPQEIGAAAADKPAAVLNPLQNLAKTGYRDADLFSRNLYDAGHLNQAGDFNFDDFTARCRCARGGKDRKNGEDGKND